MQNSVNWESSQLCYLKRNLHKKTTINRENTEYGCFLETRNNDWTAKMLFPFLSYFNMMIE